MLVVLKMRLGWRRGGGGSESERRMMKSTDLNCAERRLIVSNKADKKMIGQRNDVSVETDSEGK